MNAPMGSGSQGTSTRPYLIRALHDWCTDNGFTPYIAVFVDATVQVPTEYVKNGEIVLNVGFEATSGLKLGNDFIRFKARFGGVAREISVPITHVIAIYARENGQGMAFPLPSEAPTGIHPEGVTELVHAPAGDKARAGATDAAPALRLASTEEQPAGSPESTPDDDGPEPASPGGQRPSLKRVK